MLQNLDWPHHRDLAVDRVLGVVPTRHLGPANVIRVAFPHKFDIKEKEVSTKPSQTVASAKRSGSKAGRRTVRLTPSQVTIAKKLGVPLEEYAKYVNTEDRNNA